MLKFYRVSDEDCDYRFDVIGAPTAEDAAKEYVLESKKEQLEEIEWGKKKYAELVAAGRMKDPYEQSGFAVNVVLPKVLDVVPMSEAKDYHDRQISNERKYQSEAFDSLWNWDAAVKVRL